MNIDAVMAQLGERPAQRLTALMARLRDKQTGCSWDLEQTFATIAPYTIEEAYEVADAIERGDMDDLREELGDLLLQVVFHAQMADEDGAFDFDAVCDGLTRKMIKRHPHVFGDASQRTPEAQTRAWEDQKAEERATQAKIGGGILAGVALGLPALMRAEKLQKRAARAGFDWPSTDGAFEKLAEEANEAAAEFKGGNQAGLHEEIGDMMFSLVNLARKMGIDSEQALRDANAKFSRRIGDMEASIAPKPLSALDLDAQEALWQAAKGKGL